MAETVLIRRGCIAALILCFAVVVIPIGTIIGHRRWERADAARRAPIFLAAPVNSCDLAPSGAYLRISAESEATPPVYDTATGQPVPLPYPSHMDRAAALWLPGDLLVSYSDVLGSAPGMDGPVPVPVLLADVPRRTVVAVTDLPPDRRAEITHLTAERYRSQGTRNTPPLPSPDGQLVMRDGIAEIGGQTLNTPPTGFVTTNCTDGWRADSAGFYYIERRRAGLLDRSGLSGPVRLLLAYPPPPRPWWQP